MAQLRQCQSRVIGIAVHIQDRYLYLVNERDGSVTKKIVFDGSGSGTSVFNGSWFMSKMSRMQRNSIGATALGPVRTAQCA